MRKTEEVTTSGPDETRALAGKLLAKLPDRRVFALRGELGSGKTCFVQGLAMALGIDRIVTSPTFTIINEYRGRSALYHVDLYRLADAQSAINIGIDEYLESGEIVAIEWAERIESILPPDTVDVQFSNLPGQDLRKICVSWQISSCEGRNGSPGA